MRNIEDYSNKYIEHGFEEHQVRYRRRIVLETVKKYSPKNIIEIGCGMEPLFRFVDQKYCHYAVVEPSKLFLIMP